ncbi:MAG: ferrous iron transport protein A [Sedimentisphaerales bacterium]|nr:ferrous iron transport protein A [Sedimentisphaerales bacterium]
MIVEDQVRPLSSVKAGKKVLLVRIDAGRGLNSRLASMGLVANTQIKVVSNSHPGPFVIIVKDTRVMLGRGMAHKIMVK